MFLEKWLNNKINIFFLNMITIDTRNLLINIFVIIKNKENKNLILDDKYITIYI